MKTLLIALVIGLAGCSRSPATTVIDLGSSDVGRDLSADAAEVDIGTSTDTAVTGDVGVDVGANLSPDLPAQSWPQTCRLRMPARVFQHEVGNHYVDNAEGGFNLDVEGELVAVVGGQTGLHLFDTSAGTPVLLSSTVVDDGRPGGAVLASVQLHGTQAWVGTLFGDWFIVDIADPANPVVPSSPTFQDAEAHFVGDRLWVSSDMTLEEHDPAAPDTVLSQVAPPGSPIGRWAGLDGDNGTLWMVTTTGGSAELFELDISRPGQTPQLRLDLPFAASDLLVVDDVAYIQGQLDNVALVDVSDPSNVALRGTAEVPSPWGTYVEGDTLFVASDGNGVYRFDVSNPAAPRLTVVAPLGRGPTAVRARGTEVFVSDLYGGLVVGDFSDVGTMPSSSGAGFLPTTDVVHGLEVRWPWMYAFLRDGNRSSLAVANIANSVQAFHGTLDLGQYPTLSTGASEDLLFAFSNELSVVDASMAEDPRVIGTADVSTSGEVHAVGDLVAIDGVEWFDVSDPSRPAALGTSTLEPPRWFRLEEGRMYGAWGTDLRAYDITDPLAPQLLWQTSMPEGLDSLAIADRHLVVIRDYIWGVVFIDKVSGEILHEHPIGFFVRRVDAAGDLTVVTVEPQKMVMIDTSDGYDHVRSATIPIPYDASRLVLSGGRAVMTRFNVLFTVQICQ